MSECLSVSDRGLFNSPFSHPSPFFIADSTHFHFITIHRGKWIICRILLALLLGGVHTRTTSIDQLPVPPKSLYLFMRPHQQIYLEFNRRICMINLNIFNLRSLSKLGLLLYRAYIQPKKKEKLKSRRYHPKAHWRISPGYLPMSTLVLRQSPPAQL